MIVNVSKDKRAFIGTEYQNFIAPKFRVFYRKATYTLASTPNPTSGYKLENLDSDVYEENVEWGTNGVTLTADLSSVPNQTINAILIGNPSFNKAVLRVWNSSSTNPVIGTQFTQWVDHLGAWIISHDIPSTGAVDRGLIFDIGEGADIDLSRETAPGASVYDLTDQRIIPVLFNDVEATKVELTFSEGVSPSSLSKLWIGSSDQWIMGSGCSYPLVINSVGGLTDIGTIYGRKLPTTRQFSYSWDYVDDVVRRQMEEYMDAVQTSVAHYVMPFEEDERFIPTMFVRLGTATLSNERHISGWYWQSPKFDYDILV